MNGAVEGGLDGGGGDLAGGNVGGPGEDHAREGLGDEESVPGAKLPGALGLVVKAADPGAGGLATAGLAGGGLLHRRSWRAGRRRVWRRRRGRAGRRR